MVSPYYCCTVTWYTCTCGWSFSRRTSDIFASPANSFSFPESKKARLIPFASSPLSYMKPIKSPAISNMRLLRISTSSCTDRNWIGTVTIPLANDACGPSTGQSINFLPPARSVNFVRWRSVEYSSEIAFVSAPKTRHFFNGFTITLDDAVDKCGTTNSTFLVQV
jgi:hypothetical protein